MYPAPLIQIMYRDRRITVVIPCLNEEEGIVQVLSRMPSFVDEVIVVDNDSTDRTAEMARRFLSGKREADRNRVSEWRKTSSK